MYALRIFITLTVCSGEQLKQCKMPLEEFPLEEPPLLTPSFHMLTHNKLVTAWRAGHQQASPHVCIRMQPTVCCPAQLSSAQLSSAQLSSVASPR